MLKSGDTKSCGCLHIDTARERSKTIRNNNHKDSTNVGAIKANNTFKNNTSGCRGVTWHSRVGKWNVRLQFQKVTHELGYYSDKQEAIKVRKSAELKYFGKYLDG